MARALHSGIPARPPVARGPPLSAIETVETAFEAWTRWVIRLRWAVIAAVAATSALLVAQVPGIRMDNSTQSFLKPEDPALILYDDFLERFGGDELIVIGVAPPRVFDLDFLAWLRDLHRDLEDEVPHVDEVLSLVNARSTRGEGDALIVEDFLEDWPETPEDLALLEARAAANPLYEDFLISRDGAFTVVSVRPDVWSGGAGADLDDILAFPDDAPDAAATERHFLTDVESRALVEAVERVVERHASPRYPTHLAGTPILSESLNAKTQRDITLFNGLSAALVCALLFLLFRRASGVLLPLLVVFLSLGSIYGTMGVLDVPLSVITQILGPFLITVGVCDSVHILAIFYQRLAEGDERREAIVHAMGHSGLAVLMTSLTTAAGMASFNTAALAPIAYLGLLAPIGIGFALLYTVTLLPALLAVVPLRSGAQGRADFPRVDAVLARFGQLAHGRPWSVVAVFAGVLLVAGFGAAQVRLAHDSLLWFPEDDPFRVASELLDEELRGTTTLEVLVETGRENGLHDPGQLRRLEAMGLEAESFERGPVFVGKAVSLADVVKETHRALNANRQEFYVVPDDRQLVAQELLLFENSGSDDLEDFTDTLFSTARMTLKIPWYDAVEYGPFVRDLRERFAEMAGEGTRIEITGLTALLSRTFEAVVLSLGRSYVFAIAVITPLMMLLVGSVRRGLLSMIPNLTPIVLVIGIMGWLGISLDIATLTIGSIVLGVAVDDTIHFVHKFRRYSEESGGDVGFAIQETLRTSGRAMLFTTLILAAGFFVFAGAYMRNMKVFGVLTGIACIAAFLADVLLAPALLTLWDRRVNGRR